VEMLTAELPFASNAPRLARGVVAEHFGHRPRCAELLLCVSELVTNAVLHARSAPRLRIAGRGRYVRVEVDDDDPTLPRRPAYDGGAITGRGLRILDRVAAGWGARAHAEGKTVWCVIDLDGDPP